MIIVLVQAYQYLISPLCPCTCRFYPSCSEYAKSAFSSHGLLRASCLVIRRLLRCHPFNAGGFDPVPDIHPQKEITS